MKKFIFTVPEIHHSNRTVFAETEEEAEAILNEGKYFEKSRAFYSSLYPIRVQRYESSDAELKEWKLIYE